MSGAAGGEDPAVQVQRGVHHIIRQVCWALSLSLAGGFASAGSGRYRPDHAQGNPFVLMIVTSLWTMPYNVYLLFSIHTGKASALRNVMVSNPTFLKPSSGFLPISFLGWHWGRKREPEPYPVVDPILVSNTLPNELPSDVAGRIVVSADGTVRDVCAVAKSIFTGAEPHVGEAFDYELTPGRRAVVEVTRMGEGTIAVARGKKQREYRVRTVQICDADLRSEPTTIDGEPGIVATFSPVRRAALAA